MFSVFRQPYVVLDPAPVQIRTAAVIGVFIGLFLLIFQPFGLGAWQTDAKWLKISGFGLISFLCTAIHYVVWPAVAPQFFIEQNWTVGRALVFMLFNILGVALGNFFYLGFLLHMPFSWGAVFWTVMVTLTVGIFPTTGTVLLGYIRRLRSYQESAAHLQPIPVSSQKQPITEDLSPENQSVLLIAENEKDSVAIPVADLLYIESADNYCTVYHLKAQKLVKPLIRSSLSRLEAQLAIYPQFVRCHRSFVVNIDRVERITGNAQGYKLHLLDGQLEVPVARRYNETLIAQLRQS